MRGVKVGSDGILTSNWIVVLIVGFDPVYFGRVVMLATALAWSGAKSDFNPNLT